MRVAQRGNWSSWESRRARHNSSFGRDSDSDYTASEDEEFAEQVQDQVQNVGEAVSGWRQQLASCSQGDEGEEVCGPLHPVHVYCKEVVNSGRFSFLVALAIMLNVMCMTLEVDYPNFDLVKDCPMKCMQALPSNSSEWESCPDGCMGNSDFWSDINHSFLIFFSIELVIRMFSVGGFFRFICAASDDQGWNLFDLWIVGTCYLLWYFSSTKSEGGKYFSMLRSLRMLRMLRVLRIFRVPLFKKLNIIVQGLIDSIPSGFWIGCMLGGVIFVSAIFCTDLLGHEARLWPEEDRDQIEKWFGSMGRSMDTLFQFLTLADWSTITRVVAKEIPAMLYFFVGYVIFAAMVILSLLTGVLADHINNVTVENEKEEKAEKQLETKQAVSIEYKAFRKVMSGPGSRVGNSMTFDQFRQVIEDREVNKHLVELGIIDLENFDPADLFVCFDRSATGTLSFHEFSQGMEELRVGVTGKQIFKLEVALRNAVRRCTEKVEDHTDPTEVALQHELKEASERIHSIDHMMNAVVEDLKRFVMPSNFQDPCCDSGPC
mmetsp:Transcript_62223/g.131511  ORF Transcript_62223/g.131511 Transcript_62223/m.131511 type:complete len:545 (+) Transcript_62223:117-1751(+)